MKKYIYVLVLTATVIACQSQTREKNNNNKIVGGPCEGCEAIHEYSGEPLMPVDTLPAFMENQPKLKLTGTVLKKDGKTPAQHVIVYIYHTNRQGIYETKGDEKGWAKRHGFIRGWIKTGSDGKYTFYTFRPAAYPGRTEPEHVHVFIKEPNKNEYYIDDYVFDDDVLLTTDRRKQLHNRGGSGIVQPQMENGILTVKRDIILGKNIPDYE